MPTVNHVPNRLLSNLMGQMVSILTISHSTTRSNPIIGLIQDVDESFVDIRLNSGVQTLIATRSITEVWIDEYGE